MKRLILYILALMLGSASYGQELGDFLKNRKATITFSRSSKNPTSSYQSAQKEEFKIARSSDRMIIENQTLNNIEVFGLYRKKNFTPNGELIITSDNTMPNVVATSQVFPNLNNCISANNLDIAFISQSQICYFPIESDLAIPALMVLYHSDDEKLLLIFNSENKIVYSHNYRIEKSNATITKGSASVFAPDPITSSKQSYGGNYAHNSGTSNASLEAEQVVVDIDVTLDGSIYRLENTHVKISDLKSPNWPVVTSSDGNFYYNRSQKGFQQVNAFYHLSKFKNEILGYGFQDAVNYQIKVDADGANAKDNSYFTGYDWSIGEIEANSFIEFGAYDPTISTEVHVPDAEDAMVLIHEFTHAVINSYSTQRSTMERECLEEAICDYFAVSYSSNFSTHRWQDVYKWDGHNEFWQGRSAVSNKCYDNLSFTNPYTNTDIWTAAMMDNFFSLGKPTTDKLMLHTITALTSSTSMEQAAMLMLKMDTIYNGAANCQILYNNFNKYCILDPSNLNVESFDRLNYRLINSEEFSRGGIAKIIFEEKLEREVWVYDQIGRELFFQKNDNTEIVLDSKNFRVGIFIVKIVENNSTSTFKLIKY